MKVKSVEIARKLNISKATVSLVLNGKPGVSEETREKVFRCMEELTAEKAMNTVETTKEHLSGMLSAEKIIMQIVVDNKLNIAINSEMDLWTDVYSLTEKALKRKGYSLVLFFANNEEEIEQAVMKANDPAVAGVILTATEMREDQLKPFRKIRKPMVVYDNEFGSEYSCFVIDGVAAIRNSIDYLVERGHKNIKYLSHSDDIYNFLQRRAGFRAGLRKNNLELKQDSMIPMGRCIDEIYKNMKKYLETSNELPDACIMENYQVSIGVMRAFREKHIHVPDDVSLIGFDELPSYLTGDFPLTTIKAVHRERAKVLVMFLEKEIQGKLDEKYKVLSNCTLIEGDSVKNRI